MRDSIERKVDAIYELVLKLTERLQAVEGIPKNDGVLLVTKEEAARRISRSKSHIKTLLRRGLLTVVRHENGHVLIPVRALERYASQETKLVPATASPPERKKRRSGLARDEVAKMRASLKTARAAHRKKS